jgi:hypothetical protein
MGRTGGDALTVFVEERKELTSIAVILCEKKVPVNPK